MQEQQSASFTAAASALATYLGSNADELDEDSDPALTDEEAFSLSMEIRYRTCLRRPQFKVLTLRHISKANPDCLIPQGKARMTQVDDGSDDDELSQDQSLITPESSQRFDESYLWHNPPIPSDFAFDFDLSLDLGSPSANIERYSALNMGIEKEYQDPDPAELWSDLDGDDDFLSLSSDNEVNRASPGREAQLHDLGIDLPADGFSLVTPLPPSARNRRIRERGLDWDVNMNGTLDESHAHGSPDAPLLQTDATRIESLSPPAASAGYLSRQGTPEGHFPGLSSMLCQADGLDLELCFESDEHSDPYDLEEFKDVLHGSEFLRNAWQCASPGELEHQEGNPSIATELGAEMDGMEEDFCIGLDEDW
jgi:hypothetical protein